MSRSNAAISRLRACSSGTAWKIGSVRQQGIARKIHLRHQTRRKGRSEIGEMDVVRSPGVPMVRPRICARTYRQEPVSPLLISENAPCPLEIWIQRRIVLIRPMIVAAGSVGLPDLDHRVRHRPPILICDGAGDDDALAQCRLTGRHRHVRQRRELRRQEGRARCLGYGLRHRVKLLLRVSLDRTEIGRRVIRRLRARRDRAKRHRIGHRASSATGARKLSQRPVGCN